MRQNLRLCPYAHCSSGEKVPQCPTSDAHSLFSHPLEVRWSGTYVRVCDCSSEHTWTLWLLILASQADFSPHRPAGRLFPGQPTPGHTRPLEVDTWGPGGRCAIRGSPGQKVLGKSATCRLQRGLGNDRNRAFGPRHSYYQVRPLSATQLDNFTIFFTNAVSSQALDNFFF